jgi:hypothetical protein
MIELTRRWFVFGSAAVVAAAVLPETASPALVPEMVPNSAGVFLRREIFEMALSSVEFDLRDADGQNVRPVVFRLIVGDRPMLQAAINPNGGHYSWRALESIIQRPHEVLSLDVQSGYSKCTAAVMYYDYVDEGPPIRMLATYPIPYEGPPLVNYLDADNSLEARLARKAAAENAAPIDWDDYDWEDDED